MEDVEEQLGGSAVEVVDMKRRQREQQRGNKRPFVSQIPSKAVFDKLLYTAWMWIHTEPLMRARWWESPLNEV